MVSGVASGPPIFFHVGRYADLYILADDPEPHSVYINRLHVKPRYQLGDLDGETLP
jgi:hypothetical protein